MAKDLVLFVGILSFWFILFTGFSLVASDPTFVELSLASQGNYSTDAVNGTFSTSGDTDVSLLGMQQTNFWDMAVRVLTFRISGVTGIPVIVSIFITFFNYVLLLLAMLILFRQLRSGSG